MHKVDVPINYRPNLTYFFRNDRKRWHLEYDLPHIEKIRMILTLPKDTPARSVRVIADEKASDLSKGLLTEKEFLKISSLAGEGLSLADGLQKYLALTALTKSARVQYSDRAKIPMVFSYFMSAESFKEAKRLIESPKDEGQDKNTVGGADEASTSAKSKRNLSGQRMKEKALINGCREIGHSFTHFHQIKEEHIFAYRSFLLMQVDKRKKFESEIRSKMFSASESEKKRLMQERASQ